MKHVRKLRVPESRPASAAALVSEVLDADVHYAKCIELGIANLSAIAQQLAEKTGCPPLAAKVAVARWAKGRKAAAEQVAERTRRILSRSTLYLQNDVAVRVLENNPPTHRAVFALQDERLLSIVISARSITLIAPPESIAQVEKKLGSQMLKRLDGLCLLQLSSSEEIEDVPGVYAAVLDSLARKGINVLESSSCFTDTNVVVRRADAVRAFEALEDLCGKNRPA